MWVPNSCIWLQKKKKMFNKMLFCLSVIDLSFEVFSYEKKDTKKDKEKTRK